MADRPFPERADEPISPSKGRDVTTPERAGSTPAWVWPLVATLAMQTASAFLGRLVPTIAPVLTAATALPEESIGYFAALSTVGSMAFLMIGHPLIRRYGPVRTLQAGMLLGGFGVVMLAAPHWGWVLVANIVLGLGYGPSAPAGSDILLRHAPAAHRTLIFSLKQAGVPMAGVLAGLSLPWLVERMDWRLALALVSLLPLATALAVQPIRASVDAGRDPGQPVNLGHLFSPATMLGPLRMTLASPVLRRLTVAGCCFSIGQGSLVAFLVTYLVHRLGFDLVQAGAIFAVMQATGIVGRIALGWLSDRWGSGLRTLFINAVAACLTVVAMALTTPDWSFTALMVLSGIAGITVTSWNGVHLAEIARLSPAGRVSEATSGATLVTFAGYVIGPAGFAVVLALTDSYPATFMVVAASCLVGIASLWRLDRLAGA
jgi:MFS family permease